LESGVLRLSSSRTREAASLAPGAALGGLSLFSVGTREANVAAKNDATVLLLSRADYRRLVEDSPRTACRLAEAILTEVAAHCRGSLKNRKK
jgi:CRP-like cAMP-binding protein